MADATVKDDASQVTAILQTAFEEVKRQSEEKLQSKLKGAAAPTEADSMKADFDKEMKFMSDLRSRAAELAKGKEGAIIAYKDATKALDALKIEYFDDKPSQRVGTPLGDLVASWPLNPNLGKEQRKAFNDATDNKDKALEKLRETLDVKKNSESAIAIVTATNYVAGLEAEKEFTQKEKALNEQASKLREGMKDMLEPAAATLRQQQKELDTQGTLFTAYKEVGKNKEAEEALKAAQTAAAAIKKTEDVIKASVFEHAGKEMSDQEKNALYEHVLKLLSAPSNPGKEDKAHSKEEAMIPQHVRDGLAQVTPAELSSEASEGPATLSFRQPSARGPAVRTTAA